MFRQILCGYLVAGAFKTGVQFGTAFVQRWDGSLDRFFPLANVRVHFALVRKIKRDRSIYLLQT
jgi:hypothetical protein